MIYPVNGLKLHLTAKHEQLMDDMENAPGWIDPAVVWFELVEDLLGSDHPETDKAKKNAFGSFPLGNRSLDSLTVKPLICLIILPLLSTGLMA